MRAVTTCVSGCLLALIGCSAPPLDATSDVDITVSAPASSVAKGPAPRRPAPAPALTLDATKLRAPLNPQLGTPCDASTIYQPTIGEPRPVPCGTDGMVSHEIQWMADSQQPPCKVRFIDLESVGVRYRYGLCVVGARLFMVYPCLSCFANGSSVGLYELSTMTPEQHAELRRSLNLPDDGPASPAEWARFAAGL